MAQTQQAFPAQKQQYPGSENQMRPKPRAEMEDYAGSGKLAGKIALVTGGDSGIGRAVAIGFAKEGADVAIAYLEEDDDARQTSQYIEKAGRQSLTVAGNLADEAQCRRVVDRVVQRFGRLDILVNNIAYQHPVESFEEITTEQWDRTFKTNIYSFFWMTRAALPHMREGAAIINTASINGLRGNPSLIDYSATKGAVLAFTYSLAQSLAERKIRVNAVAPGPVWTPLIPSTMPEEKVKKFGQDQPMGRAAQPDEIAPSYIFFASGTFSSYYNGEVLAPIGGETLPG